jgi:nucleotide-binding universal stress UspA family protein
MNLEKTESDRTTTTTIASVTSEPQVSSPYINPQYNRILVPHDGSENSDKALSHAVYLSNMSGAEIVILHVVEHIDKIDSSSLLVTSKEGEGGEVTKANENIEKSNKQDYEVKVEGQVKQMIEDKMNFCKRAGVKSQVSYKIQTGKPSEEIVKVAEDMNSDLIVMASSRSSSSLAKRLLGSTSRKVIDSIEKPLLVIHG